LEAGAEIVNDVSGLRYNPELARVVRKHRAGIVLMHLRGTPRTMQQLPPVRHIVPAIQQGLAASLRRALSAGIRKRQIMLDPGIGFGKTIEQNFEILTKGLPRIARMGYPILVGPSRKSFIRRTLEDALAGHAVQAPKGKKTEVSPEEMLYGTAAAVTIAVLNGAHIVRVHDVRQMLPVARLADRVFSP
jgi:dihydropteroate synthase